MKIYYFSVDGIRLFLHRAVSSFVGSTFEYYMIQRMDGVFCRSGSVTGGVFYDVTSGHKRKLLAFEDLFKPCKIGRIGDIYRNIIGENVNIFLVRNGHAEYLAPLKSRLSLLGPAELVQSQINFVSHVAYFRGNSLMTAAERIESSWEKGYLVYFRYVERPDFQLVIADKTIYMFQHCCVVEEIQFFFAPVFVQSKDPLSAVAEDTVLFIRRKADRTEDIHADGPEGFLTYHSVIVGETANNKAYEFILSIGSDFF